MVMAAKQMLAERLADVARAASKVRHVDVLDGESVRAVHILRVATRRADAALAGFSSSLDVKRFERVSERLNVLRKAAGVTRDADVLLENLKKLARRDRSLSKRLRERLAKTLETERTRAGKRLVKVLSSGFRDKLVRSSEKLLDRLSVPEGSVTLEQAATDAVNASTDRVRRALDENLRVLPKLHDLRLAIKDLRYTLELFGACLSPETIDLHLPQLVKMQAGLGLVNDDDVLLAFLVQQREKLRKANVAPSKSGSRKDVDTSRRESSDALRELSRLIIEQRTHLRTAHSEALKRWKPTKTLALLNALATQMAPTPVPVTAIVIEPKPVLRNGTTHKQTRHTDSSESHARIAAIDIGSNSLRLIIAEVGADGAFRVLDDEKEVTRLGRGLHSTGRMDADAIEHTVQAVGRMLSIARGYGATTVRVVATAAAREASNAQDLILAFKDRLGVGLDIISGDEEAMLAYRSASRAFDLGSQSALVIDIGGGSTDMVLSATGAAAVAKPRSLIERVYSLSLGAVRLTEKFGGPERSTGSRFDKMRSFVREALESNVGKPPLYPQIVIGTGGTLTTLGAMSLLRGRQGAERDLFSKVQGAEVARADVKHFIEVLRRLPVSDRSKIAGLSSDRADIIVAGLVIVDAVLKHFGANRLRVHEGGIRDGLLLEMTRSGTKSPLSSVTPIAAVRRFAEVCNYEAAHSLHVTYLALQIFDQLQSTGVIGQSGRLGGADEARLLLEAAAILHDIGYLINYAQHHKHAYHLIVHAELPGLTTRQSHVIANIARYHRAAEPKLRHAPFAALAPEDQTLVRLLAGILRVADGLDRPHMQGVKDVRIETTGKSIRMIVSADEEPSVELWGAKRKAELFERTLNRSLSLEWATNQAVAMHDVKQGMLTSRVP
jgi:exopolyphosphatase/guanosine-5'-triphosphate,3'-diphosphate pyrophosphatase